MQVRDFMTTMIITSDSNTKVSDAAKLMAAEDIGCLIVTKGDLLVGIVTRSDLIGAHLLSEDVYCDLLLEDIMNSPVVTITPEADIGQTITIMNQSGRRHIPVIEGNEIIGLVTAGDIIRVLATVKLIADHGVPDDYAGE
jgi:CBS domain-containing protein